MRQPLVRYPSSRSKASDLLRDQGGEAVLKAVQPGQPLTPITELRKAAEIVFEHLD